MAPWRVLLVSTPIGALGTGLGGGVELTIANVARALGGRGHHVEVVAPAGSRADGAALHEVGGAPPPSAQREGRDAPTRIPPDSLLANMFSLARQRQDDHDVLVNFAYDWLGFYLTPFFSTPLAHVVSMGSLLDTVDAALGAVVRDLPGRAACHTHAQAATFAFGDGLHVVGNGLDLAHYEVGLEPEEALAWVARISPEKGLEDALAAAARVGLPLRVFGVVDDEPYWEAARRRYPGAVVSYEGFLPTERLQAELGRCQALLVTPRWDEAFGNVVAEALACGVPVVTYGRGGPAELVADGETGFVVEAGSVPALVAGIERVGELDRATCRRHAEAAFSLEAFGDRLERWLAPQVDGP
ncbi:MAG: glycosyltransferase [Acidimicrobiia bacterium]|nr:glycosyltransferase [Acidimicrobiia bacterium]